METILITGVSGGIGGACCEEFLQKGYSVVGVSRKATEAGKRWKDISFHGVDYDLTQIDGLKTLINEIVDAYGPIRGFVHCAGFDKMSPMSMTKPEVMEDLWRIHAQAPMLITSYLGKKGCYSKNMSIVLISSQSAHEGAMGHTAYASAKGAIEGFLAPAAAELMEKGIRINILSFSPVRTGMADGWMDKLAPDMRKKTEAAYTSWQK